MSFTENVARSRSQQYERSTSADVRHRGNPIHRPRTSLGAAGHWIHIAAVAAPLIIGEVIQDPSKRWRALRIASVAAALASEAVWTIKAGHDRHREKDLRDELQSCNER